MAPDGASPVHWMRLGIGNVQSDAQTEDAVPNTPTDETPHYSPTNAKPDAISYPIGNVPSDAQTEDATPHYTPTNAKPDARSYPIIGNVPSDAQTEDAAPNTPTDATPH